MGDVDAVRKLAERQALLVAKRYRRMLRSVYKVVPGVEMCDMGSFHLLRVANALRSNRKWSEIRNSLNKLLEAAGNPERLPELPCTYVKGVRRYVDYD